MAFKKPQINQVKNNIEELSIYLRSVKKFGKTTLFRDLILEKYGDPKKGLLVGVGNETGYSLLDNLNVTQAEDWDDLEDIKDWLIEKKGIEHDIKIVAFDVIDELMPLAEEEIKTRSTTDTGKICKTFNSAYGGYGEPRKQLSKLVKEYFTELKKAGIMPFAIAHTKVKSIKEKGEIDDGYNVLSSNLNNDYESLFGDIFDCVLTGKIDRDIENNNVKQETRKLYFRGDGFVDAGCRFSKDSVPEYIVFDKANMAREFINVLEEGLKKSRTKQITDEEFKANQIKEEKESREKAKKNQEKIIEEQQEIESKEEKIEKIKENLTNLDMASLQKIMTEYEVNNFEDVKTIPMKCLDEILALI